MLSARLSKIQSHNILNGFSSNSILFFLALLLHTPTHAKTSLFESIAQENLKTLTMLDVKTDGSLEALIKKEKHFYEILDETLHEHKNIKPMAKRRLVFTILSEYDASYCDTSGEPEIILDQTSWQDLEIVSGNYLAQKIDRTSTEIARVLALKKTIQPTCNITYLRTQQAIIKELLDNKDLFNKIQSELTTIQETENIVLSFWQDDIFLNLLKQNAFNIPYAQRISQWANRTPSIIEIGNITEFTGIVAGNAALLAGGIMLPVVGIAQLFNNSYSSKLNAKAEQWGLKGMSYFSLTGGACLLLQNIYRTKNTEALSSIVSGPMASLNVVHVSNYIRATITLKRCIQIKLMACARYLNAMKNIALITKNNAVLQQNFNEITQIDERLKGLAQQSKEIKQLLTLLESNTFKGNPSFFSSWGTMYVTYSLFSSLKTSFVPTIVTVGHLDTYMSCARLMKEGVSRENIYCFADYLQNTNSPSLEATDFWNPAMDHTKAITNSIEIGNNDDPQNIIVSGPNGGGKSTIMKGIVINCILAQTWGITAAKQFTLTPFAKIMTYLNITDDIAQGTSLFKAGVLRAHELLNTVKNALTNVFTLTAIDEVFNGTSHEEGQAAAYALIHQLGSYNHNMCFTISHYPKIPLLADATKKFKNYKVSVLKYPDGTIYYPYKLVPGISYSKIALEILQQEGFGPGFLAIAQKILNE